MVWGWVRTLQTARRRLVGMIAFITLSLLFAWPFTEAGRFLIPLVPMVLVGLFRRTYLYNWACSG